MKKRIAFIGLGAMGSRVANHFIESGHEVFLYNRNKEKASELVSKGGKLVHSPKEAAVNADVVMVMVRDDKASKEVWLDPERGALHGMTPSKVAVDLSTLSLSWVKELAETFRKKDIEFIEAPVVGTRPQAESKSLVVLASGSETGFKKAEDLLHQVASKVVFLGKEEGKAATLKLVINSLFGIQAAAFSELFHVLNLSGFSKERTHKLLSDLAITSPAMKLMLNLFSSENYQPLFPIELVEKDFGYSQLLCEEKGIDPLMVKAARGAFNKAKELGFEKDNISGVIKIYKS